MLVQATANKFKACFNDIIYKTFNTFLLPILWIIEELKCCYKNQ